LRTVAWLSLALGVLSAIAVAVDIAAGRRQRMWIMNVVWPLTALYSGPIGVWAYATLGRPRAVAPRPLWQSVVVGTTHCGSGCTLGDVLTESLLAVAPTVTLFGSAMYASWALDYVAAFIFGIAFQYFAIGDLKAAVKADAASLTAWQIGMYGWMAVATFVLFGHDLPRSSPVFWFMMQIGMLVGFGTSYPVNWWLIRRGIKEEM
jgi:Domain of unknown function (DUF4396)